MQIEVTEDEPAELTVHIVNELTLLGSDEETIEKFLKIVRLIDEIDSSSGPPFKFLNSYRRLIKEKNLTPLSDDAEEWEPIENVSEDYPDGLWASRRNKEAFSEDGGRTYFLIVDVVENFAQRAYFHSIPRQRRTSDG